jgi:HK97 family phage portal protein
MLETRQFSVPEICRWFRISPHLAGDLSNATFSNIEQLALEFVNFTLHVWLKRWEQEFGAACSRRKRSTRVLLAPQRERAAARRFRGAHGRLLHALQNGFMSQNEVRDLEDWNGFEGGDDYHIQFNMQQLPTAPGNPQAQSGNLVRLNNGSKYRRVA